MPQFYQYVQQKLPKQTIDKVDIRYQGDLLIVKSSEFLCMPEHFSEDYLINLVPSAPPPLTINRREQRFHKKSAIIMPPGMSIASKHEASTQDYYLVSISAGRFNDVLSNMDPALKINKLMNFPYSRSLFSSVQSLCTELENKNPGYDMMVQSKLTEFIILLTREGRLTEGREKEPGSNYNYVERALEYIHSYYNADISLDDLCTELNLSRYHFVRIFKARMGVAPHAYLMNLRLQNSLEYLKKSDYNLNDIAALCGFVSQSHYTQCFKKKYGVTPAFWRGQTHDQDISSSKQE